MLKTDFVGTSTLKDLLEETVSHCLFINMDRSTARREAFETWAKDLSFHRVSAVDGHKLDQGILTSKNEHSVLGPREVERRGAIGCAMSHLKAIESAMALVKSGDDRPVLIMEDDARILAENLPALASVVRSGQAGDHCLLGSLHQLERGLFPIATEHPHIVEPTGAMCAAGYLVSPRMLPVLRDIYTFNLERPEMRLVDCVNDTFHRQLSLGMPMGHPVYEEAFLKAMDESFKINNVDAPKFRATNPSIIGVTRVPSTICPDLPLPPAAGKQPQELYLCTGRETRTLRRDDVKRLNSFIDKKFCGISMAEQAFVKTTLHEFANGTMSFENLMDTIQTATNRLADKQHRPPQLGL